MVSKYFQLSSLSLLKKLIFKSSLSLKYSIFGSLFSSWKSIISNSFNLLNNIRILSVLELVFFASEMISTVTKLLNALLYVLNKTLMKESKYLFEIWNLYNSLFILINLNRDFEKFSSENFKSSSFSRYLML